jgi:hypothetical protein
MRHTLARVQTVRVDYLHVRVWAIYKGSRLCLTWLYLDGMTRKDKEGVAGYVGLTNRLTCPTAITKADITSVVEKFLDFADSAVGRAMIRSFAGAYY